MVMVKVAVIDLLSSDHLIQTCFQFRLVKAVDAAGTYLDGVWSTFRISEWGISYRSTFFTI